MNKDDTERLVNAWVAATRAGPESFVHEKNWWAIEKLMQLSHENPELLWGVILKIIEKASDEDERLLGNLAAGPLEDLMRSHGERFIDRVEQEANSNPRFKSCLGGVWLDSEDTNAWRKFYEIADIEPPFDD